DLYAAMDWLAARQPGIEDGLAARHLAGGTLVLYDVSSAAFEGRTCPLGAIGHPKDGVRGRLQIVYGLLTSPGGIPVAIEVFKGNTGDPKTVASQVTKVKDRFGITKVVLAGDRGMLTAARLREDVAPAELDWITALRAPQVKALVRDGDLQLSLFDQTDLAEITSPDFPGERLVACKNPFLEAERARNRESLLAAAEADLAKIAAACTRARAPLRGTDKIAVRADRVLAKRKIAKHFTIDIGEDHLTYARNQDSIAAEAALDGIYVLRTSVPADTLDAAEVVAGYKNLANVERDFRIIKVDDLDLRPIHHRLDDRVKAHVLICMLACYLVWHLRKAWAPMTFTDEHPPQRANPVAPAQRSGGAATKASRQHDESGNAYRSFRGMLDHLATLTRNQIRYKGTDTEIPMLAEATRDQRRAFQLLDTAIPLRAA
ncbi:IS1634 family transposase, partial [Mycobacterium sp.]|uniref:IS1634 family transposase n=1 Tax=Mycobacterium sp. TaxID=1785 RepID=UPI0039C950B1